MEINYSTITVGQL